MAPTQLIVQLSAPNTITQPNYWPDPNYPTQLSSQPNTITQLFEIFGVLPPINEAYTQLITTVLQIQFCPPILVIFLQFLENFQNFKRSSKFCVYLPKSSGFIGWYSFRRKSLGRNSFGRKIIHSDWLIFWCISDLPISSWGSSV